MYDALRLMKEKPQSPNISLYPLLPYAQTYARIATEKGVLGLAEEILSKLSWRAKATVIAGGGLSLATMDPAHVLKTYVDAELDIMFGNAPKNATLRSVFLHEILTDLATSFHATELISSYASHIMSKYHVKPGFATRNFTRFVAFAKEIGLRLDDIVILTPFNKVGFQMNPSREACEKTLSELDGGHVIAMSILASGYLNLPEALQYVKGLHGIKSYVVGTSTQTHAKETFSQMKTVLAPD
jgi:hypothetical protein